MPSFQNINIQKIPQPTIDNNVSIHQGNSMVANLASVHSSSGGGQTPTNKEVKKGENPLFQSKETLHSLNSDKQVNKLVDLFKNSAFPAAQWMTPKSVQQALTFSKMGNIKQQSLNYRPESSLITLTLLKPNEMNDGLLESAAKLINDMQGHLGKSDKDIIKKSLSEFDNKIQKAMAEITGDNFLTMVERFENEYVVPEFEKKLVPHLSESDIKNLAMKDCLVSAEYQKKAARIEIAKQAYKNTGTNSSVDKSFYLHEAFETLEEFLEIPKTLKVTVDWEDKLHPAKSGNVVSDKTHPSDEVDGLSYGSKADSSRNISNSYNTTTTNNYFNPPFSESIKQVSSQESTAKQEQDSHPSNNTESVSAKPFENDEFLPKNTIQLPRVALKTPVEEPSPDYDLPNHSAQNSQEIDTVESRNFIKPNIVSDPSEPSLTREEKIIDSIRTRFKLDVELAQKNSQPMDIKPKMGSHYGSYLVDNKVPNGVRLTNNRERVQDKSMGQTETESNLAIKNASHYRTSYINNDDKVVLSAEGLMTRDLNEKLAYANKPQGE